MNSSTANGWTVGVISDLCTGPVFYYLIFDLVILINNPPCNCYLRYYSFPRVCLKWSSEQHHTMNNKMQCVVQRQSLVTFCAADKERMDYLLFSYLLFVIL